jgi:general secretion pathway protein K
VTRHGRPGQRGYVLVLVLGLLALASLIAARFSQRIDELRRQAATLEAAAQQRLGAGNALNAVLYVSTTRPLGAGGLGAGLLPDLATDDRPYRLPDGSVVSVQDGRGLYPLNAFDRLSLGWVLTSSGVAPREVDAYIDVLEDYEDTDGLKHLNGAEAPEYAALGLAPPRNDWLVSVQELNRMPLWRDTPEVTARVMAWGSASRQPVVNPNTAPLALMAALLPGARPEQLDIFDTLRHQAPFLDARAAVRVTGLPLDQDRYIFHTGPALRITVAGPGAARALQYNVLLSPAGLQSPWQLFTAQSVPQPDRHDSPNRETPFPLALAPAGAP